MKIRSRLAGALALILLTSSPVAATTIWINLGSGDWFDGSNWNSGVPTSVEPVQINNGGTAIADATSGFYPGGGIAAETAGLSIGYLSLISPNIGYLQLNDVDLNVSGDLILGTVEMGASPGTATGSIVSTKAGNDGGDVSVSGDAEISAYRSGTGGTATGSMNLQGNLAGMVIST